MSVPLAYVLGRREVTIGRPMLKIRKESEISGELLAESKQTLAV